MHFADMLPLLAADCGLPAFTPDASGAIAVSFAALVVNLRPGADPESITLDARLGTLATVTPETVIAMMADNRWPRESIAGTLAIDAAGSVFLVHHLAGHYLTFAKFRSILQRFATQATHWRARLSEAVPPSPPPSGSDLPLLPVLV